MGRKKQKKFFWQKIKHNGLDPNVKTTALGIILLSVSVIFIFASFDEAGRAGELIHQWFSHIFGLGYYFFAGFLAAVGIAFLFSEQHKFHRISWWGTPILILASLSVIDILSPGNAGILGQVSKVFTYFFDKPVGLFLSIVTALIGVVITFNISSLRLPLFKKRIEPIFPTKETQPPINEMNQPPVLAKENKGSDRKKEKEETQGKTEAAPLFQPTNSPAGKISFKNYTAPPLSLLKTNVERPTAGDLRANANIIKRTLESFGIPVEMGEITIGPKVTRYTLKPAEGVKLSKITALNQDLALALACHPLRIEAPIPGKSLVGIEVPNKIAALVRLGSLMSYPDFNANGLLSFALGRDINGEPIFPNVAKMPHLLIAGSTGSGKSIAVHSLIVSLIYKNSPETLRFILIDPKRVELSIYEDLPHLMAPVITEGKKAIAALRFVINEMEKRYEELLRAGCRDISGYNSNRKENIMPSLIVVIDELADLMASYGREIEGSIVRLAQMARATGIHLVVSTQRPSVEVITGLIKANITARVALQVASQVDSRTILDIAGAEKLLGGGDMLYITSDISKPKRIQGSYISEEEIKTVVNFISKNNPQADELFIDEKTGTTDNGLFTEIEDDESDELYLEALTVVKEAKKASASLLQRRLKVGYARAARLLDIMEDKGLIGPGEGAKPREVYFDKLNLNSENDKQ